MNTLVKGAVSLARHVFVLICREEHGRSAVYLIKILLLTCLGMGQSASRHNRQYLAG